jgi:iron complex transport system substrate-binding protein
MRPNAEAILRLKPDLVILQTENAQIEEHLSRVGARTVVVKNRSLRDLLDSILVIGRAAGAVERAAALTSRIEQELDAIRRKTAGRARRTLLFIVGRTPGRLEGLIAAGRGSHLHELIEIAGGRNALGDVAVPYPRISLETTLRLDPDVIVDMGDMGDTTAVTESHKQAVVRLWSERSGLRAARENHVYAVSSDIYVVPGPRVVEAVRAFARMLHPEVKF